jgi:hypothetical protein
MPATLVLTATSDDLVKDYLSAMSKARRKTGRFTLMAARSFCGKLERADWSTLPPAQQVDAISKARSFASWLLITGRLTITRQGARSGRSPLGCHRAQPRRGRLRLVRDGM